MSPTDSATRAPVEILREVFEETLNRRDADALVPLWGEEIVEVFPHATLRGRDEVRNYFAETFAALPDFQMEPERIVGEGEIVFVKWRLTGTFSGASWMGIAPTGTRLELRGMDCITVRNGLVAHNFVIFDQASFARQIGMLPGQDSAGDRAMTAAFNARTRLKRRLGGRTQASGQ